ACANRRGHVSLPPGSVRPARAAAGPAGRHRPCRWLRASIEPGANPSPAAATLPISTGPAGLRHLARLRLAAPVAVGTRWAKRVVRTIPRWTRSPGSVSPPGGAPWPSLARCGRAHDPGADLGNPLLHAE